MARARQALLLPQQGRCKLLPLEPRDRFAAREFLTIAINKQVVEMATNDERKKAISLQQAMETQLLALEKLGALLPAAADEVRNIVAEGIANKFGEPYRSFPCTREGVQIRRDAVPTDCSLRESVKGFVANASTLDKPKTKGQEIQKKATSQTISEKDRTAFNALAQVNVNKPQRNPGLVVGQPARYNRAEIRKTSSPEKQQPKACSSRANPCKGATSESLHQASLERGQKAWDALLAKKAAEKMPLSRNDDHRKSSAQETGKPSALIVGVAGAGLCKNGRTVAAAAPNNGASAHKGGGTSRSLEAIVKASGEGKGRHTTPRESVMPPSKPSTDCSEDLIDFGF